MPAGIFISYRRQDALKEARAIFEKLSREFGAGQVFIDLEGLDYGVDFVESLYRQLQHCEVMLALIGPGWLDSPDGHGGRRLDDANDPVRFELRTALQRNIRVVPVLFDGAPMPRTADLPADLEALARRNKIDLDFTRFDADIGRLVSSLRRILMPAAAQPVPTPLPPTAPTPSATPTPAAPPVRPAPAPQPEPMPEPAPAPVQTLLGQPQGGQAVTGEGSKPKTVWMVAGAGAALLGAVWYANQPPKPEPAVAPPAAAASVAASPAPAPAVVQPSPKSAPPAASTAEPSALTAAQAEALRQTKPDGQEIYASLQLKPKEPPPQPKPLAVGQRFRDCDDDSCPWMVVLPAGSFLMGSPESEPERHKSEGPQHRVKVASFAVGQYEVTFRQWDACVGAGGCKHKPGDEGWGRGQRPVINVSWSDAQQYVKWLSGKTGQTYRLPSESEWEYAARAGTSTPFAFGERISTAQANFNGNSTYNWSSKGEYRKKTLPVGSLEKNAWELYDLHGNVWEWVQDCSHASYQGAPADGRAWVSTCAEDLRPLRGGAWFYSPGSARSAIRYHVVPTYRHDFIGFRLARMLP